MNILTSLRLTFLVLCSFIFTTSYAQKEEDYFITVWDLSLASSNTSISFYALTSGDVNYTWETIPAGQSGSGKFSVIEYQVYDQVNIYNLPASKTIKLKLAPQNLRRFYFTGYNNPILVDVSQWGTVVWNSMQDAFRGCTNFNISAIDFPNLSNVKIMNQMFYYCYKLNGPVNINQWNTQNVTDMGSMFSFANSFNQPIGNWNTENVTDMINMFYQAYSFNQPIGNWNTGKVTRMRGMFATASSFNQPIENWITGSVTNMSTMFSEAKSFNQPIGNWNTQNVTDMVGMFSVATNFNQPIGNWNTQNVTDMGGMFSYATSFNQPIGSWNTGKVISMRSIFFNATSFNQAIGNWNTGSVTDMNEMFNYAKSFNQPVGNWNTQNVTDMAGMFIATNFNQPIGNWNTEKVTNMGGMFSGAEFFNQPVGNWNTGSVTYMTYMFSRAKSFNQPVGNWDIKNVKYMNDMFSHAFSFNQPVGDWNTKNVINLSGMFLQASSFNQPIENWNTENVTNMRFMFYNAKSFNQNLGSFKLNPSIAMLNMLDSSNINCTNYLSTLNSWANNPNTPTNKELGAAGLKYSPLAQAARDLLTKPVAQGGKGWTISGDALSTEDCGLITSNQNGVELSVLSIFPNPAQDKLYLKNAEVGTAYKIIDGLGKEINAGTCQNEEISIAGLQSGLYTLVCGNRHFTFVKE